MMAFQRGNDKKTIENRIKQTEEQMGNLVEAVAAVNRKQAR